MIDLTAGVAALEPMVEQMILERLQQTENPQVVAFMAMRGLAETAVKRGGQEAPEVVDILRRVLMRVMNRLGER